MRSNSETKISDISNFEYLKQFHKQFEILTVGQKENYFSAEFKTLVKSVLPL